MAATNLRFNGASSTENAPSGRWPGSGAMHTPNPTMTPITAAERVQADIALARLMASRTFARSERLRAFLRFIVEQAMKDSTEIVKEYTIAVAVYGRRPSFDPRKDPIIRVEGRRLRAKLAAYYCGEGQSDTFELHVPVGRYIPKIRRRTQSSNGTPAAVVPERIAVKPFSPLSDGAGEFSRGLTEEVLHGLRVEGLSVTALDENASGIFPMAEDVASAQTDAILRGTVRTEGDDLRISARLTRVADQAVVWSEMYARAGGDSLRTQQEVACRIACAISDRIPVDCAAEQQSVDNRGVRDSSLVVNGRLRTMAMRSGA